MKELNYVELQNVDGGSNLGNTIIVIGGVLIAYGITGPFGVVAGATVSTIGLLSSWE